MLMLPLLFFTLPNKYHFWWVSWEALFTASLMACQRFTMKSSKPTPYPYFSVYPSLGIPNASPAAGGHTTNDPQLLLHDPKPAHYHPTIPPAPGQHHPTVYPGPAPAFLQLPTTAATAKVSPWRGAHTGGLLVCVWGGAGAV